MFETTLGVLHESPFAIVPLVAIVWFVGLSVRRSKIPPRLARYAFVFGAIPPFCLFLAGELLGSPAIRDLGRSFLHAEIGLFFGALGVLDTLIGAVLRAVLAFVAGLVPSDALGGVTSIPPAWNPFTILSAVGFLVAVFVVHFVTGLVVMRLPKRESSLADEWLTSAGVVLFVSGMVWMLLQFDPWGFGQFELRTAVLASSMGLITGVTVSNLPVDVSPWPLADGTHAAESKPNDRTTDSPKRSETAPGAPTSDTAGASAPQSDSDASNCDAPLQRLQRTVRSLRRR